MRPLPMVITLRATTQPRIKTCINFSGRCPGRSVVDLGRQRSEWSRTMDDGNSENERQYLTPPDIAKLLRVSPEKVLGWICRGELKAVNVSNGFRPRFRVSRDKLDAFFAAREVQPPPAHPRRKCQPP